MNTPVSEVVNKLTQCYQQGKTLMESIYTDETWNLQVALLNNALMFRAAYIYKSGKSDFNDISISAQGQISESNPQVKVRKDLIEKMESIAKSFYSHKNQEDKENQKNFLKLAPAAILRHYDELPDNIARITLEEVKNLAETFINQDKNSGKLNIGTIHQDSDKLVLEYRIKDSYLSIIRDTLITQRDTGIKIDQAIQNQMIQDLIEAELDTQKTIQVIIKNLKYMIEEYALKNYSTPDVSRLNRRMDSTHGYILYNKSNQPIQFEHINYTTGQKLGSFGVIKPCESAALSCAEVANLLSGATINNEVSNAILTLSSSKPDSKVQYRNKVIMKVKNGVDITSVRHKDVMMLPINQWVRFLDINDLIKHKVDKILSLVFPDIRGIGEYNYLTVSMHIMENVLKNRGCSQEDINKTIGKVLTDVLEINGKRVQVDVKQNRNGTYDIGMKSNKNKEKKSILAMFKR